VFQHRFEFDAICEYLAYARRLRPFICDTSALLNSLIAKRTYSSSAQDFS
jgi:hypothetical protein